MRRIITVAIMAMTLISGCTQQERAKRLGGEATIRLEPGQRVVNATWKENNLWVLTKIDPSTTPQKYTLKEYASYGVFEGAVIIVEQ